MIIFLTAPGKINDAVAPSDRSRDQEGADTDAEQPSHESVQWQAVRQDVGFCNRPDRRAQEASAETDHHECQYGMACDDAEQCRHQSILVLPSLVSQS
jgi:hypothetical protein